MRVPLASTNEAAINIDQCGDRRRFVMIVPMATRNPQAAALALLQELNSRDLAVRTVSDRALEAAREGRDGDADFWVDVFWVLIEIDEAG